MLHAGVAEQFGVWDEGMFVEPTLDALVVHDATQVVWLVFDLTLEANPGFLDGGSALGAFERVLGACVR